MSRPFSFDKPLWDRWVNDCAHHYEKTAPLVEVWLDEVCARMDAGTLTLNEMTRVMNLEAEPGSKCWIPASYAQNTAYRALSDFSVVPVGANSW